MSGAQQSSCEATGYKGDHSITDLAPEGFKRFENGDVMACCCFFFFQAEDGIRDYKVTGVQTCALPIYWRSGLRLSHGYRGTVCSGNSGSPTDGTALGRTTSSLESGIWHALCIARFNVDRKSTRLNSSHLVISYAVFCLKKKRATR